METTSKFMRLNNVFTYDEFKNLVLDYTEKKKTTGEEQLLERVEATKINAQRMYRIDKQVRINPTILELVKKINSKMEWILLAESWCGDGAQNIPVIAKIATASNNINLKIILRDENPEIMDSYLMNGSRSIPRLICIDEATKQEVGTWGPRPARIQQMVKEFKMENPDVTHEEFVKNVHLWYAKDRGESLQLDFEQLLTQWINP